MDSKKEQRLAELERLEARWREANREFKCRRCGAVLGAIEFEDPGPDNDFRTLPTTTLRVRRGAIPLPPGGIPVDTVESILAVAASQPRSYTDLRSSPNIVPIDVGVKCRKCGTERKDVTLAPPFQYANELGRLRHKRWHESNTCVGAADHVS